MNIADRVLAEVSKERIRQHIQVLEGVRHPLAAPRELEAAGDYIRSALDSMGYEMTTHGFRDDDREFVNIKVDREERPDVDRVYMTFVQATTGGGGWPMSVFLTVALFSPFLASILFFAIHW